MCWAFRRKFFYTFPLSKFFNATFFNVIEILLSFHSMVTLYFYCFTEIFPFVWSPYSLFPIILQDPQMV